MKGARYLFGSDLNVVRMKPNLIVKSLVGAPLLAMVVFASGSRAASGDLPGALVRLGERVGCRVPSERPPGVVTAWIVEQEAGSVYAAWCVREGHGTVLYDMLVTAASRQHAWAQCAPHIKLGLPEPFPHLRATTLPKDLPYPMTLNDFWYVGEDYLEGGERVAGSGVPTGPALDIGVEEAGNILVCLRGRWIMGGYH